MIEPLDKRAAYARWLLDALLHSLTMHRKLSDDLPQYLHYMLHLQKSCPERADPLTKEMATRQTPTLSRPDIRIYKADIVKNRKPPSPAQASSTASRSHATELYTDTCSAGFVMWTWLPGGWPPTSTARYALTRWLALPTSEYKRLPFVIRNFCTELT
ncbi:hypothetical protein P152DRAFT_482932 [Eremomyces bilateralis CBS 781.70]|uniref:Uncharacterized protein n=1 Tax=Eremomyces bilateralis CBS 781.70 TaxID=1392243 RepID=A0A6G1G0F3_9PEZI|nr:uncharacterized protein P152DRAFT_482932 [Eremomyces bilateralis CBS 781.70]KAF1811462.1 hypothetical protein P152DRAFT_482932 [Eremomyces bilateralis CBS 781.70]